MIAPTRAVTRQQRYMTLALGHVRTVQPKSKELRDIYGGLCHSFPVLVRTCGLCQALAFVESKAENASGDRREAYRLLRHHVTELLDIPSDNPLNTVREADIVEYMRLTRTVLHAWIFYKRFAVSILKVDSVQAAENEETPR